MRRAHVADGVVHHRPHIGNGLFKSGQQRAHGVTLEAVLRTTQVARQDGIGPLGGENLDVFLSAINEGPDDSEAGVIGEVPGGHRLHPACIEQVHHQGLKSVVAVVPQSNLVAAKTLSNRIENSSTKTGTQEAVGLPFLGATDDDGISVFLNNLKWDFRLLKPLKKRLTVVSWLNLVEVHADDVEVEGCATLGLPQQVEQGVAVLAS